MRIVLQPNNGPDTQKASGPFVRLLEDTLLTATNLSDVGRAGHADHGYPVPHYSCYRHSCFVIHGRLVEPGNNRCNTRDGLHEE